MNSVNIWSKIITVLLASIILTNILTAQNADKSLYKGYQKYLKRVPDSVKREFVFLGDTSKKKVALTFDDGPTKKYTKNLIQFLTEKEIPAAFFVIAKNLDSTYIDVYKSEYVELGGHSYNHDKYRKMSYSEIENDIYKCVIIFKKFGLSTYYFRPPYGLINGNLSNVLKTNQMIGVLWSLDSQDWKGYKGKRLVDHITNNLENGSIILLHENISLDDLDRIISGIIINDFQIVSLSELIE